MDDLEKIDRKLIELLGDRIECLRGKRAASLPCQLDEAERHVSSTAVGLALWRSIIVGTMAGAAQTSAECGEGPAKRVAVVGGLGMMGRFMCSAFHQAGHDVSVLDRDDWPQADSVLGSADLVIVSVPIEVTHEVIDHAASHLRADSVLADITSIKQPYLEHMLRAHRGPVVGLHPMFGPKVRLFLSQRVVICHGRGRNEYQWIEDMMRSQGAVLVEATAEEHDRMMISVQAIRHFATFALGHYLACHVSDVPRTLDFASPIYRLEVNLVGRLFAQSPELYVDIMLATPERRTAIKSLAESYKELAELASENDRDGLIERFRQAATRLKGEAARALDESVMAIDSLSLLLAARQFDARQVAS
jgi:prephenate dehydrogenase/chorismate mutase/prephenate dehydrogenase